jgi:hypothetical protein
MVLGKYVRFGDRVHHGLACSTPLCTVNVRRYLTGTFVRITANCNQGTQHKNIAKDIDYILKVEVCSE